MLETRYNSFARKAIIQEIGNEPQSRRRIMRDGRTESNMHTTSLCGGMIKKENNSLHNVICNVIFNQNRRRCLEAYS